MVYETQRFKTTFIRVFLRRINPILRIDAHFFKIHYNIVLPYTDNWIENSSELE